MAVPYAEVIGDPIAHSKSPLIHRFWLNKLGLEGDYKATRVPHDQLLNYLAQRRTDPDWRGCNVTSPHKVSITKMLDELLEAAKAADAVNTIISTEGALVGTNTDIIGFAEPFRHEIPQRGSALLIGAGGAARAVFVSLVGLGFQPVAVANRTPEHAAAMLRALGQDAVVHPIDAPLLPVDLVVNASSMGMEGSDHQMDLSALPDHAIIYDIVYSPPETRLLLAARRRVLRTVDGISMLIGQADASFRHFFNAGPPREHDGELRELLTR